MCIIQRKSLILTMQFKQLYKDLFLAIGVLEYDFGLRMAPQL